MSYYADEGVSNGATADERANVYEQNYKQSVSLFCLRGRRHYLELESNHCPPRDRNLKVS